MFKKIFLLVLLFAPVLTFSQVVDPTPAVYIKDIRLEQNSLSAGDTVSGSFLMLNGKNEPAQDITYALSLVGGYGEDGLAQNLYETVINKDFKPIVLSPLEERRVVFSYKLPLSIGAKDLGIQIQAQTALGMPMGWSDAKIKVSQGLPLVTMVSPNIIVDGKNFGLEEGPTIRQDKKQNAYLSMGLYGNFPSGLPLVSKLTIYDRTTAGAELYSTTTDVLVTSTSSEKNPVSLKVSLPNFEYKPGVYAGTYELLDKTKAGVRRASLVSFRYIVSGDIAEIHSVVTDKQTLHKGDNVKVSVVYTGVPLDINNSTNTFVQNGAMLEVSVYNESDALVLSYKKEIDFSANILSIEDQSSAPARAMRAYAKIYRGDVVLAEFDSKISRDYEIEKLRGGSFFDTYGNLLYGFLALVGFVVLIVIAIFVIRTRARKDMYLSLLLVFVCGAVYFGLSYGQDNYVYSFGSGPAPVFVETSCTFYGCGDFTKKSGFALFLNEPRSILKVGEKFFVQGFSRQHSCSNQPSNMKYEAMFEGQTGQYTSSNLGNVSKNPSIGTQFSIGAQKTKGKEVSATAFVAPSTPGVYRMYLKISHLKNWVGTKEGYIDFTVVSDEPVVPVDDDATVTIPPVSDSGTTTDDVNTGGTPIDNPSGSGDASNPNPNSTDTTNNSNSSTTPKPNPTDIREI